MELNVKHLVIIVLLALNARNCLGQTADITVPDADFVFDATNSIAYKGVATTWKFNLKIRNGGTQAIASVASGKYNYGVDFYFAYANVNGGTITGTTSATIPTTAPLPALDFGLAASTTSTTVLTFTTSATLPSTNCASFQAFCACVRKGADAVYTDTDIANNCACKVATPHISCEVDLTLPVGDFSPDASNPLALMGQSTTLKFNLKIKNTHATYGIGSLATGKANYAVDFYFSTSIFTDITAATNPVPMTTSTSPALEFGLVKNTLSATLTFEATGTQPITGCGTYKFFCGCVKKGADALYTETPTTNNCACKDASTLISCSDIIIKAGTFTPDAGNPIALKNSAVALKFQLTIENSGTAPGDIAALASGLRNYAATFYFSFADLGSSPTATNKVALTNTLEPKDLHFGLPVSTPSSALSFETTGTLPTTNCNNYAFLCGCISRGPAGNYADKTSNNCQCKASTDLISCSADIKAEDFVLPAGTIIFIKNTATNLANFDFNIKNNAAAAPGNNIVAAAPKDNFAVDVYFAQADLGTTPLGTKTAAFVATAGTAGDVQVALVANTATGNKKFTANGVTLPLTNCNLYKWLCACVKKGAGAQYIDADTTNNCKCVDANAANVMSCYPDIVPTNLDISAATPAKFVEGIAADFETWKVQIKNLAAAAAGNAIRLVTSGSNYAVDAYFAQVDLKTTPTGTKSAAFPATATAGDLKVGLAAGATTAVLTLKATNVILPTTDCIKYTWICACVKEGTTAKYIDSVTTNNCECADVSDKISCNPDIEVTSLTFESGAVFPALTGTGAATRKSDVGFTVVIQNKGTTSAHNIARITSGNDENFHLKFTQTDIDAAAPGGCANPLSLPQFEPTTDVVLDSANDAQNGLLFGKSLTIKGTLKIGLKKSADCLKINYLCVNVDMKDVTAPPSKPYVDSYLNNNCLCTNIKNSISCAPDIRFDSFTGFPDSSNAMIGTTGMSGQSLSITLTNAGVANERNNIRQTTGTNRNFLFTGYYATSNTAATSAAALSTYRFTINLPTADLQSGLDATKSATFTGTIDFPALTLADCTIPLYACIHVAPDNRANGGTFVEPDGATGVNYKCEQTIVSCSPDPKPSALTPKNLAGGKLPAGQLFALQFSFVVTNVAATKDKNNIPAVTGSLEHFKILLQFSDVDMSTSTLDTLNLGTISTTFPVTSENQAKVAADNGQITMGGTTGKHGVANVLVPEANCEKVKYLCLLLYASADARYVDRSTDIKDNTACLNSGTATFTLECQPDVEVTALTFASNAVFPKAPAKADVEFSVTFKNIRTKNIAPITDTSSTDENFHIKFQQSDKDLRAAKTTNYNPLSLTAFEPSSAPSSDVVLLNSAEVKNGLIGGKSLTIKGKIKFGLSSTKCTQVQYLCVNVEPKGTAPKPYVDADTTNNWLCGNINSMMSCAPDLSLESFTKYPNSDDPGPLKGTLGMPSQPLSLTIKNVATKNAFTYNDVRQATGSTDVNFALTGYYATADDAPTAGTSKTAFGTFTIALSAIDLKSGIKAEAQKTFTGTISYPALTLANCLALTTPRVCIYVAPNNIANGGTFVDPTTGNNFKCYLITLTCRPDPKPENLQIHSGSPVEADVATAVTVSLDVKNDATGTNNLIPALGGAKTNFKVELQFSDVDLSLTPAGSAMSGRFTTTITVLAENQATIAAGGKITLGATAGRVAATITLTEALCPNAKFLCAILLKSDDDPYEDASAKASATDLRANSTCLNLITPTLLKTCHPDVEVTVFNEPNNIVLQKNVEKTVPFEVTVRNNDANTDIKLQTVTTAENFHLSFMLSNVDIRATGTASNTLGIAAFENAGATVLVTVVPASDVRLGLRAGQSLTLKGSVKVKVPNDDTKCAGIRFLCVKSMPKASEYPEDKTRRLNNWKCKDIRDQISCGIDVEAVSFTSLPTAAEPLVGPLGRSGVSFTLNIRNRATGGQGLDIAAASGTNKNFAVTSFYSSTDMPTVAPVGTANTLTIADSALRVALPGTTPTGATTAISGTINYSVLNTADCNNANFICMKILEVPGQATYTEATATLKTPGSNTRCYTLQNIRTCAPDPKPDALVLATNLVVGASTVASFTVKIKNTKTTPPGSHDVINAATAPNYNYKFELQLSDVNIATAGIASDTLGLAKISTISSAAYDAELRTALAISGDNSLTKGTASIPLPTAKCHSVKFLCAFLSKGTGAYYVDSDTNNNIFCSDITAKKGCTPDPAVDKWSVAVTTPLPMRFVQDVWQDLTVTLDLKNLASGAQSNIATATTWNYRIFIKFTDVDLATSVSTINSTNFLYVPTGSLKAGMAVGATLTLGGSVRVAIPKANCNKLNFLCVVMHHNSILYGDRDTKNNKKCLDVTTIKVCSPDVDIISFTDNPTNQFIKDSSAEAFTFEIKWKNIAPAFPGNDIPLPPTNPAGSKNFKFQMTFSDVNIGLGQTDTLNIAKIPVTQTFTQAVKAQTDVITETVTIPKTDKLVIPQAKCEKVNFLCIYIEEGANAQYSDADKNNNVECMSIVGTRSKKNCRPVFTNLNGAVPMNENTATATSIFQVKAKQGDVNVPNALTFSIDNPPTPPFEIDATTGVVKTKLTGGAVYDFEAGPKTYTLTIKVTDGTTVDVLYSPTATLTVNVQDVNEKPVFNPAKFTVPAIPENKAGAVYTMTVADPDRPHQTMTYSIEINPIVNPSAPFHIQRTGLFNEGKISLSAPGMNYEAAKTYSLTVHVTDGGTPPLTANPLGLVVVPCTDVPEIPTFTNLPKTITLNENVANHYNTPIFTVSVKDPDAGTTLQYFANIDPNDGKIVLEETNILKYKANPKFDYEYFVDRNMKPEYKVTFIVRDGKTPPQTGVLTIKLENNKYGDLPIIDETTCPTGGVKLYVAEDVKHLSYLHTVVAHDPDKRSLKYSLDQVPYTNPGKFGIDSKGRIFVKANPGLDFETQKTYTLAIKVCANANCTSNACAITVNVLDKNDAPVCTPSSLEVSTTEGSYAPGRLFTVTDQDAGDTVTYRKDTSTLNNGLFTINAAGIITVTGLNYDSLLSPVSASFTATDSKGAKCTFALTVNILDTNTRPSFIKTPYKGTIDEDKPTDTSILTVEAVDSDIGQNAVLSFAVLPDANKAENHFKLTKIAGANKAILKVQSPKDRETMTGDTLTLKVVVKDGGGATDTADVTITVNNVNDNKPTFTQDLYNYEMMYNDSIGHVVGAVSCNDKDVAFNVPSYNWLEDQLKKDFKVDAVKGVVSSAVNPLKTQHEYVLLVECKDNDPVKQETSLTHVVRVDTYYGWEVLTKWTTSKTQAFYDIKANLDNFLAGASALCTPCVARLHSRSTDSSGNEVLTIYFLTDSSTDQLANIGKKKEFLTATHIMAAYTTDKVKTPASSVTASKILSTEGITSIVRYKDAPVPVNWMLDTIAGNILIGCSMFLALAVILTAVVCIASKASPLNQGQRLDTPPRINRQHRKVAPSPQPPRRELTAESVDSIASVSNVSFEVSRTKPTPVHNFKKPPPKQDIDPPNDLFKEANRKTLTMKEIANAKRNAFQY